MTANEGITGDLENHGGTEPHNCTMRRSPPTGWTDKHWPDATVANDTVPGLTWPDFRQ